MNIQLPDGSYASLDPRLPFEQAFHKLVAETPQLQHALGVKNNTNIIQDIGSKAAGAGDQMLAGLGQGIAQVPGLKGLGQSIAQDRSAAVKQHDQELSAAQIQADNSPWLSGSGIRRGIGVAAEALPYVGGTVAGAVGGAMAAPELGIGAALGMGADAVGGMLGAQGVAGAMGAAQGEYSGQQAMQAANPQATPDQLNTAGNITALGSGALNALIPAGSSMMAPWLHGVEGGVLSNIASSAVRTGLEMGAIGGGTQASQNLGLNVAGQTTPIMQGVGNAALQGLWQGAVMGGGMSGLHAGAVGARRTVDDFRSITANEDLKDYYAQGGAGDQKANAARDAAVDNGLMGGTETVTTPADPASVQAHQLIGQGLMANPPEFTEAGHKAAMGELTDAGQPVDKSFKYGSIDGTDGQQLFVRHSDDTGVQFLSPERNQWFSAQDAAEHPDELLSTTTEQQANPAGVDDVTRGILDQRRADIQQKLGPILKTALGDKVGANVTDHIAGPDAQTLADGSYDPQNKLINLAVGLYDKGMDPDQAAGQIMGVANHEILHGAVDAGVVSQDHLNTMVDKAKRVQFVDDNGDTRKFTYWEKALNDYGKFDQDGNLLNPDDVNEEAAAELNRYQAGLEKPTLATYRNFSDKITNFMRNLTGGMDAASKIHSDLMNGRLLEAQQAREAQAREAGDITPPDGQAEPTPAEAEAPQPEAAAPAPTDNPAEPVAEPAKDGGGDGGEPPKAEPAPAEPAPEKLPEGFKVANPGNPKFTLDDDVKPETAQADFAGAATQGDPTKFSIIGQGGIQNIAPDALAKFQKDEARGRHPNSLYKETGIWRGRDGKIRYELDSSKATLSKQLVERAVDRGVPFNGKLGMLLRFPELYKAYPHFADNITASIGRMRDGVYGSFGGSTGELKLNDNIGANELHSTALHEIQHAIQTQEQMAGGGNPGLVAGHLQWARNAAKAGLNLGPIDPAAQAAMDRIDGMMAYNRNLSENTWKQKYFSDQLPTLADKAYKLSKIQDDTARNEAWNKLIPPDERDRMASFDIYQKLHGETEARDVQARRFMTPEERMAPENSPLRNKEYEGTVLMNPTPLERAPWTGGNKFSVIKAASHDTDYTPNTVAHADEIIRDPNNYGPSLQQDGSSFRDASLMAAQYTATGDTLGKLLSPMYFRGLNIRDGKIGLKIDDIGRDAMVSKILTNVQDESYPLRQLVSRVIKNGGSISDKSDPVAMQILYHGRTYDRINSAVSHFYKPLAHAVADLGGSDKHLDDLASFSDYAKQLQGVDSSKMSTNAKLADAYLYARHAQERNEFIKNVRQPPKIDPETGHAIEPEEINDAGSGMSDEEARQILSYFDQSGLMAKMKAVSTLADSVVRTTNRVRERGGLTPDFKQLVADNQAERARIQAKADATQDPDLKKEILSGMPQDLSKTVPNFKYYVPIRDATWGSPDEEGHANTQGFMNVGQGFETRGREDKQMKGRSSYGGSIIENLMAQHQQAIIRSGKNQIGQAMLAFLRENKDMQDLNEVAVIDPPARKIPYIDPKTGKVGLRTDPKWSDPQYRDNVFMVKEGGQEVPILFKDPNLRRATEEMSTLGDRGLDPLFRLMRPYTRAMSNLITSLNPEFAFANITRDVQEAAFRGSMELGVRGAVGIAPKSFGYVVRMLHEKMFMGGEGPVHAMKDEVSQNGGFTGVIGHLNVEEAAKQFNYEIEKAMNGKGMSMKDRALWPIKTVGHLLEHFNDAFESATRIAAYEQAKKAGYSDFRSGQIAKTASVNFNARGRWTPQLGAAFELANARIQGSSNFLASMGSRAAWKLISFMAMSGVAQELWNMAAGGDDPDKNPYEIMMKQNPNFAENNWVFVMPGSEKGYVTAPKPDGFSIFHDAGRYAVRASLGKMSFGSGAMQVLSNFASSFNATGFTTKNPIGGVVPSVLKPLEEVAVNRNYQDQNVHPTELPFGVQQANSATHFANTPGYAVWAAKTLSDLTGGDGAYNPGAVDWHPDSINHAVNGYLGGAWQFLTRSGQVAGALAGNDMPGQREMTTSDIPVVRRFYGQTSDVTNQKYFDDQMNQYVRLEKQENLLAQDQDEAGLARFQAKYARQLTVASSAAAYAREMVTLNRSGKQIMQDPSLDDESKKPMLKDIQQQKQDLMKQALKDINDQENALGL